MGVTSNLVQVISVFFITLCSLASLSPSGSAGIGLIMGIEIESREIFKYSLIFIVLMMILMAATVIPLGSIIYK